MSGREINAAIKTICACPEVWVVVERPGQDLDDGCPFVGTGV